MNFDLRKFARLRVHIFRVTPYFSYSMMMLVYINTVIMIMLTSQSMLLKIAECVIIIFLVVAFVFMYKIDDNKDVLGKEQEYMFYRNPPMTEMLKILKKLEEESDKNVH